MQTLAYGLHDSPVGQLAWIVEMFQRLTDPVEGLPEEAIERDRLLTEVACLADGDGRFVGADLL